MSPFDKSANDECPLSKVPTDTLADLRFAIEKITVH